MSMSYTSDIDHDPSPLPLFYENRHYQPQEREAGREENLDDQEFARKENHFYGDKISLFSDDLTLDWKEELGNKAAVNAEIGRLARRLIRHRGSSALETSSNEKNSFVIDIDKDPYLDPYSHTFDSRSWMKALLGSKNYKSSDYGSRIASVAFRNLQVYSLSSTMKRQQTVGNLPLQVFSIVKDLLGRNNQGVQILHDFDGLVMDGEMLLVLGRPGSGCSTLLKTISGDVGGLLVDDASHLNYQGCSSAQLCRSLCGRTSYMTEADIHVPQLTVGEILSFISQGRAASNPLAGISTDLYAEHMRDAVMAMLGMRHTINTRVGNSRIPGISKGERKRLCMAETALSNCPIQCWDNTAIQLDNTEVLEFFKTLRLTTDYLGTAACISMRQVPQAVYDIFDKVTLLYEGYQIFFGTILEAKNYFTSMGFVCPENQTTPDFLLSMTDPSQRLIYPGLIAEVPRTPYEFSLAWQKSICRMGLICGISTYDEEYQVKEQRVGRSTRYFGCHENRTLHTLPSQFKSSTYQQIKFCIRHEIKRLRIGRLYAVAELAGNFFAALILSSLFSRLPDDTSSFANRGSLFFAMILLCSLSCTVEINQVYMQLPMVEKHARLALYTPLSASISAIACGIPSKLINTSIMSFTVYFIANLRREPRAVFVFWSFILILSLTMSSIFRTLAVLTRNTSMAMFSGCLLLVVFTACSGFPSPVRVTHDWIRWISYIDPFGYTFEALMINEFSRRYFPCATDQTIPSGPSYDGDSFRNKVCSSQGAITGSANVSGDDYIQNAFGYISSHLWRNLAIIIAIFVFFTIIYLFISHKCYEQPFEARSLIFRQIQHARSQTRTTKDVEERNEALLVDDREYLPEQEQTSFFQEQGPTFHWHDICYELKQKGETRRVLDHIDGWIKPGTCTAVMGPHGAGKTALLEVLSQRTTCGIAGGEIFVDGKPQSSMFFNRTAYIPKKEVQMSTMTVRESLRFSASLRHPSARYSRDKLENTVSKIIHQIGLDLCADMVVGKPGKGLNDEQRKKLNIGLELVAEPELLIFLDEPTTGQDSQTAWSIMNLLGILARSGYAILCVLDNPSTRLFERFDRLLLLAKGGKPVYFGEIGPNASTVIRYFEINGANTMPENANPAHWILEAISTAGSGSVDGDWAGVWRQSPENLATLNHLAKLKFTTARTSKFLGFKAGQDASEFSTPFHRQLGICLMRLFRHYWRTPSYIYSNLIFTLLAALFIGIGISSVPESLQGFESQFFSVLILMIVFRYIAQQIVTRFCEHRELFEAMEGPSKMYTWKVFMLSTMLVEFPWNFITATFLFFCYYFPSGLFKNDNNTHHAVERAILTFLLFFSIMVFTSTFAHMTVSPVKSERHAKALTGLGFFFSLMFCGMFVTPPSLPAFWRPVYHLSPFSYGVSGLLVAGISGRTVTCDPSELFYIDPPVVDSDLLHNQQSETSGSKPKRVASSSGVVIHQAKKNADNVPTDGDLTLVTLMTRPISASIANTVPESEQGGAGDTTDKDANTVLTITTSYTTTVVVNPGGGDNSTNTTTTTLSCEAYMTPYIQEFGGYLVDVMNNTGEHVETQPGAAYKKGKCAFCPVSETNTLLASNGLPTSLTIAWRNLGILWIYNFFNIIIAMLLYRFFRVPRDLNRNRLKTTTFSPGDQSFKNGSWFVFQATQAVQRSYDACQFRTSRLIRKTSEGVRSRLSSNAAVSSARRSHRHRYSNMATDPIYMTGGSNVENISVASPSIPLYRGMTTRTQSRDGRNRWRWK